MKDDNQPDLPIQPEGEAYARTNDKKTSHISANAMRGRRAGKVESACTPYFLDATDGRTSHELEALTGLGWGSVSPRMRPMVRKAIIRDSGRTRLSPFNKPCTVFELCPKEIREQILRAESQGWRVDYTHDEWGLRSPEGHLLDKGLRKEHDVTCVAEYIHNFPNQTLIPKCSA